MPIPYAAVPAIRDYRDLTVWQRSIQLVVESYRITELLPASELYGLTAQIRQATVSVAANIAEGHGRRSTGDYTRLLAVARGSLSELETLLHIAQALALVPAAELAKARGLADEVGRMLATLVRRLGERRRGEGSKR